MVVAAWILVVVLTVEARTAVVVVVVVVSTVEARTVVAVVVVVVVDIVVSVVVIIVGPRNLTLMFGKNQFHCYSSSSCCCCCFGQNVKINMMVGFI